MMATEEELHRLAEEELLREAKLGAMRASVVGAMGWHKCSTRRTNKRFLKNTILFTINSNKRIGNKTDVKHLSTEKNTKPNCKSHKMDKTCYADVKNIKKSEDRKKDTHSLNKKEREKDTDSLNKKEVKYKSSLNKKEVKYKS